jgi:hypothetical protein
MREYVFLSPTELKKRAEICRALANGRCHAKTRKRLLEIADLFEELAQRLLEQSPTDNITIH